ncbi:hypothetical protein HPB49_019429 [Dermacentor silvarum]|uniref:Uncharacterized protein n=1 Tax=Dermacentor silvarum TaxID=543639 RepID=A0ACB8C560_DERSI|nr:hypothetical protein HPB49_019429 [Dermacentor silvarum]
MPRRRKSASVCDPLECRPESKEEKSVDQSGFPDDHLDDLDTLASAVDTVVLCLNVPLDHRRVPDGCTVTPDLRRVFTEPKTLVARKGALANLGVSRALFAGCAAFSSSKPYRRAAMSVLAAARSLCIIHNRDSVCKLASWFPSVTDLALPHNLAFRGVCSRQDCEGHCDRKSSLERIVGDAPALGSANLELDEPLLSDCLLMLPNIVSVHSALDAVLHIWDVLSDEVVLDDVDYAYLRKCPEVILGSWRELPGTALSYRDVGVAEVTGARSFCPAVRKLEVVFEKKEALTAVVDYKQLTSLSLMFAGKGKCRATETELSKIVRKFVDLERLDLQFFSDVDLRSIAEHCPKLTNLSLHGSALASIDVDGALLPKRLTFLRMGPPIEPTATFLSLLECNRKILDVLRLEGDDAAAAFLDVCAETEFPSLRRLTLDTSRPIRQLGVQPEDLHDVAKNLPALKCLVTDSYDLRLYFEYYVPSVAISWCICTVCIAERSRQHVAGR